MRPGQIMALPDALEILLPWRIILDSPDAERLSAELMSELSPAFAARIEGEGGSKSD